VTPKRLLWGRKGFYTEFDMETSENALLED
jgi:hypothetical protein